MAPPRQNARRPGPKRSTGTGNTSKPGSGGIRKARAKQARVRRREPGVIWLLKSSGVCIFEPGHLEYERSVAASNLLYRFQRPTFVAQPATAGDVQTIVRACKRRNVPITIKNGGHSYSGSSFPDDGCLLDLKRMHKVTLDDRDPARPEWITVQGGAIWSQAYRALINAGLDGLAVNGSRCPTVGVSGFMLGGGLGPFSRSLGLGVDSLLEISIVTADGRLVVVKQEDDPFSEEGILFWALCGAGGGNFGVVVELKMSVLKLQCGDLNGYVTAGRHTWHPTLRTKKDNDDFLATMNRFYTNNWGERATIDSSWLSDTGSPQNGNIGVRFLPYYDGNKIDFDTELDRGIQNPQLLTQLKRRTMAETSTRFLHETLFVQWDEETKRSTTANSSFRIYSSFCFVKNATTIAAVTQICKEQLERFGAGFRDESASCQVTFIHTGGAIGSKPGSATAFRWREADYHAYITCQWPSTEKFLELDMRTFLREFKTLLRPHSIAGKAGFVGFPDASLGAGDALKTYYGNNRRLLRQVKRIWDKDGFFRWGQGIVPAPAGDDGAARENIDEAEVVLSDEDIVPDEQLTDEVAAAGWDGRGACTPRFERLTQGCPPAAPGDDGLPGDGETGQGQTAEPEATPSDGAGSSPPVLVAQDAVLGDDGDGCVVDPDTGAQVCGPQDETWSDPTNYGTPGVQFIWNIGL